MNKLNWPTALVIVSTIFAGALIYNKPITASNSIGSNMIAINEGGVGNIWQLRQGQVRWCIKKTKQVTRKVQLKVKWNSATGKYEEPKPKFAERSVKIGDVACSAWSADKPAILSSR